MHISLIYSAIENLPNARIFQDFDDISVCKAKSLVEVINKKTPIDLVFFDASLGIESITQQVQLPLQEDLVIKWLIINPADIQQSLQYLQLGASGVLTQLNSQSLQKCFQSISNDQLYLETDLVQILAMRQINKTLLPFKQLTAKEFDVFCLLAEDYSIQKIAQQLSITTKTAFNCQTQVRKKLKLRNQQHIVKQAKKYGLVNK